MGQKDITEKVLEDYNDVFADIINGLLFDGVQEIKPEALENTTIHTQYKAEDGKVHELERDIAKYWKEEKSQKQSGTSYDHSRKYDLNAHPPLLLPISDWKIQRMRSPSDRL